MLAKTIGIFLVTIFLLTCLANATEIPAGPVSGDWFAEGNPYNINGEIVVQSGASLYIHEGVNVFFQGHYKLIVNGYLEAVGTEQDSILFTASDPVEGWHGIRFISAPESSRIEYCLLMNGSATGSGEDANGGAIHCYGSNPIIRFSTIIGNSATLGGGISCIDSSPWIGYNKISRNSASGAGGIYCSNSSSPIIDNNTISENVSTAVDGGGIYCSYGSTPVVSNNLIWRNTCHNWYGGGIFSSGASPMIIGNSISENYGSYGGGGLGCTGSGTIIDNLIIGNSTDGTGGGLHTLFSGIPTMIGNTFSGNSGTGAGFYCGGGTTGPRNSILWGDFGQEISWYVSPPYVYYSDVQGLDFGGTNIMSDPLYINADQKDYRLQWGSPCIDSGDPDPIYNDPDGTRADMGAFYYDQSMAQRILVTPHDTPIEIPPDGGSFDYTIWLTNIDPTAPLIEVMVDLTLPDGSTFGPVIGPVSVSLDSGMTIHRFRTQIVPENAPTGIYSCNARAVVGADTSADSFSFTKLGTGGVDGLPSWINTGESIDDLIADAGLAVPVNYALRKIYPNPFNPMTTISYQLLVAGSVSLKVYDVQGRKVATLINGYRQAGLHEATFDGSNLASGIYFYRLEAGDFNATGKMVFMK